MTEELETFTDMVLDYLRYVCNPNRKYSPVWSKYFKQEAYQDWAVTESIQYVLSHPDQLPLTSLLEFSDKLDEFACLEGSGGIVFSSAKSVVEDMIFRLYGTVEHSLKDYISKGESY